MSSNFHKFLGCSIVKWDGTPIVATGQPRIRVAPLSRVQIRQPNSRFFSLTTTPRNSNISSYSTQTMSLPKLVRFLLNPSHKLDNFSPYLQNYLQSSPLTLIIEVFSACLASITLRFQGLPFRDIWRNFSHLLNRIEENYADNLHSSIGTARARLFFSTTWTSWMIFLGVRCQPSSFSQCRGFGCWPDRLFFWANILSTIPILIPLFKKKLVLGEMWTPLKSFNSDLEHHNISTQAVDKIYHWTENLAIWLHVIILLYPFRNFLSSFMRHPWLVVKYYISFYTWAFFAVLISFSLAAIFGFIIFHAPGYVLQRDPYTREASTFKIILTGGVASLCYASLLRLFRARCVSFTVWAFSDAAIWAGFEGLVAWVVMMNQDSFGEFMHRESYEKEKRKRGENAKLDLGAEEGKGNEESGKVDDIARLGTEARMWEQRRQLRAGEKCVIVGT
ncbi:uncharacterized protein BDR25DRAFT_355870 [Lindgomyces ingoldianus]|uniref:Uncharacterized protein n=1 Tax=Lindgomyces ingoldianus TaxID=673940 RepID=A0ACB6QTE9_9PLEO|nr:uncharacterized protein BDR25DRAFT_355870 [Lindgomyces ingoldianus]KAF2470160.1 hypothetical protein BDR25DRAFT_355870 [Lindgomyces ingoldianus]